MSNRILKLTTFLSLLLASFTASATIVSTYQKGPGVFGGYSSLSYDSIFAEYNDTTHDIIFEVDYNGNTAAGGWLVISPGPNPKRSNGELGIAYFDATSGDVWTYAYNGLNNSSSYSTTDYLGYFAGAYSTVGDVATIAFSADYINSVLETGFAFGSRIGIWFHPARYLTIEGDANGLTEFETFGTGWFDSNFDGNCYDPNTGCITQVPEPRTWLLFALGLGFLVTARRKFAKI